MPPVRLGQCSPGCLCHACIPMPVRQAQNVGPSMCAPESTWCVFPRLRLRLLTLCPRPSPTPWPTDPVPRAPRPHLRLYACPWGAGICKAAAHRRGQVSLLPLSGCQTLSTGLWCWLACCLPLLRARLRSGSLQEPNSWYGLQEPNRLHQPKRPKCLLGASLNPTLSVLSLIFHACARTRTHTHAAQRSGGAYGRLLFRCDPATLQ